MITSSGGPTRLIQAAALVVTCAAGILLAALPSSAAVTLSEKRVALVIGNGAYQNAVRLDNAVFDAKAVADSFRKLGFQVVDGYDLDIDQMRAKVSEFSAALSDSKSAVVYYAGHGVSVDEENYLIPTDIVLKSATDLDLNAISVSLLLKQMKRDDRVNIVILDACRDNPFAASLAKQKTRALVVERGLTPIEGDLARGTLIAFASDPKSTALDGRTGEHSPFTAAFLSHLFDPGVTIDTVMSRVRNDVWEKTGHRQLPWVNTSLIGEYELNPGSASVSESASDKAKPPESLAGPLADSRRAQEDLLWESAQHSNLSADYQAYLSAFPNGVFAQMAKNRIANMENARTSTPAPAPQSLAMTEPTSSKDEAVKEDLSTADAERALNLGAAGEKEVQQRLGALDLYKGPKTGTLDAATRSALAQWQKRSGFAPTSFLDSTQLAALKADSETEYQKSLAAQAASKPAQPEPRRALARPSPKPSVRAAKRSAPEAPARRAAKRTNSKRYETADQVAPPPPAPDPGGSPEWRRKAGLPELPSAPGLGGRPPGFWLGSSGGLLLGGFRRY